MIMFSKIYTLSYYCNFVNTSILRFGITETKDIRLWFTELFLSLIAI